MTHIHLIKTLIELLALLCLYLIAVKQNRQGGRISVLEETSSGIYKEGLEKGGELMKKVNFKEPSFKAKIQKEEQRMNKATQKSIMGLSGVPKELIEKTLKADKYKRVNKK